MNKPMLLIPLMQGSRGDQVDNARSFEKKGWAITLKETDLHPDAFLLAIRNLAINSERIKSEQSKSSTNGIEGRIVAALRAAVDGGFQKT